MADLLNNKGVPGVPTAALDAIQDPNTQMVLRAMVDGWQVRNGASGAGDARFITKSEIGDLVVGTVSKQFGLVQGQTSQANIISDISRIISDLQAEVLNSRLWQDLSERISLVDIPRIFTNIGNVETVVKNEVTRLEAADLAQVTSISALGARVGTNETGLSSETTLRVNSDNALAAAVNTLWATVGNNSALVSDGSNITANQVGAVAERWNQTQAAIKDPTTGEYLSTAAVRQYSKTEVDKVKNALSAEYTVKVDVNGYVAGFGIIANNDLSSGATSSDFGVRADRFFVGSPNGGNRVPFIVLSSYDSHGNPPGVYMESAMILNASIGSAQIGNAAINNAAIQDGAITNAKIGDAAITNAKIGYAEIDALKVAGNSISVIGSAWGANSIFYLNATVGGTLVLMAYCPGGFGQTRMACVVDNGLYMDVYSQLSNFDLDYYSGVTQVGSWNIGPGNHAIGFYTNGYFVGTPQLVAILTQR